MQRSAKGMSLGAPIDIDLPRTRGTVGQGLAGGTGAGEPTSRREDPTSRPEDIETLFSNPLRDEPNPVVVKAVRRFGLVGLVTSALFTGAARWWHSLFRRKH